jgi:hypothetical protein
METRVPLCSLEEKICRKKQRTLTSSRNAGWLKYATLGLIDFGKYGSAMKKWIAVIWVWATTVIVFRKIKRQNQPNIIYG